MCIIKWMAKTVCTCKLSVDELHAGGGGKSTHSMDTLSSNKTSRTQTSSSKGGLLDSLLTRMRPLNNANSTC